MPVDTKYILTVPLKKAQDISPTLKPIPSPKQGVSVVPQNCDLSSQKIKRNKQNQQQNSKNPNLRTVFEKR